MKILQIQGDTALAEVNGVSREIGLQLLPDTKVNDWVIIHAGFAIAKLDEQEAQESLSLFRDGGYLDQ